MAPQNPEVYFPDDSISENDDSVEFQSTDSASDDEYNYTPKPTLRYYINTFIISVIIMSAT